MGEIINKISFNGNLYDITIPHGTVSALQSGTNYNVVTVSSLPTIGQMIAITFPVNLMTPIVVFQTDTVPTEVSAPMTIMYKGRGVHPNKIIASSTYSFIISQVSSSNVMLNLIGDLDSVLGAHASSSTSYGVGTNVSYGHVKTITGDMSAITSHTDGHAAATYHSHSIYNKTFYLPSARTSVEAIQNTDGTTKHVISIDAGEGIGYDLENGDMLIFPLSVSESVNPNSGYYSFSGGLTIQTLSGVHTFSFLDENRIKFNTGVVGYTLICVVQNDEYLKVLNPVEYAYSQFSNYTTTAYYATTATQANKITTTRYIDGLAFNGSANVGRYGVCTSVGSTAIKKVSIPGLTAVTGAIAHVKFNYAHTVTTTTTATRARLVLNNATYNTAKQTGIIRALSTGYYLPSGNSWANGQIVEMIYDGTYWNIISPYIKPDGFVLNPSPEIGDDQM